MDIVPIWKDTYYETSASTLEYTILCEGGEIFHGKAVKSPAEEVLRIHLNPVCADFLNSIILPESLSLAMETTSGIAEPMVSYLEFSVVAYNSLTELWDTVMEVAFTNDTSYGERTAEHFSEPINGHCAAGQLLPYSVLVTGWSGTVCYEDGTLSEYTMVNSIYGDGNNNYIALGIDCTDTLEMEWSGEFMRYANNVIFGWTGSTSGSIWRLYYPNSGSTSNYNYRIGNTSSLVINASTIPLNEDITLTMGNFYIELNGTTLVSSGATHEITTPMPFYLNTRVTKTKGIKLWDNGVLVFNGLPAVRNEDNKAGLLDSVSGEFFTNGTIYYD